MESPAINQIGDLYANDFELLIETKVDGNISLKKYKSKKSGITFVLADVKGPIVSGYLCLATEAFDHDGLPHTLEHLVFLGSESYPYKGVLDLLASRCLASGTNAWTAVDHTCYEMTTAGSEGFLNLLPIYMDHILYPTLKGAGYITEVHHINGEGEDSGTVYCEMQGRENTGESLCHSAMLTALYPGHCGYKSETGGKLKELRESTSNEKVRNYHKALYRPENLCIIITGQVDAAEVFRAVQPIEEKILEKGKRAAAYTRPWQSPVPPLDASLDQVVPYPCDDDTYGMLFVGWRGPCITNILDNIALEIMLEYLTDTSVAPLQKEFVEIDDPFCGDVGGDNEDFSVTTIALMFQSVPKEKLDLIKPKLIEILKKLVESEDSLDMKRISSIIHNTKLQILSTMESDAHKEVATRAITDFLYGHSNEELFSRMEVIPILEKMEQLKAKYYIDLMKKYMVDAPMIVIKGEASPSLMKKMTESEKERIAATRSSLGEQGLQRKKEELKKAIETNEIEAPVEVLTSVPIPGVKSIQFYPITQSCSYVPDTTNAIDGFPLENMPCHFELDDIQSAFVLIVCLLDTSLLSTELRLYLPLWTQLTLVSPILRNEGIIPYEEVITDLSENTLSSTSAIGAAGGGKLSCGSPAQVATMVIKVEPEKYEKGVSLLKEALYDTQFVAERIAVVAKKMIKDVSEIKRNGSTISYLLMNNLCYSQKSNKWAVTAIRQQQFLTEILKKLETNPQEVIAKLEETRRSLKDLTIHMSTNVKALSQKGDLHRPWMNNFLKENIQPKSQVEPDYQNIQPLNCGLPTGVIAGIGATESAFLVQSAPLPISYTHPDLPALYVVLQYLTQFEGPLWREIRGQGLSYGFDISPQLPEQQIYFSLYKSSNINKAYKVAKSIVENHVTGVDKWEQPLLESSRSSVLFAIIGREKSVSHLASQSILAYLRNLDMDYNRKLLEQVSKVQLEDLKRVAPLYLIPLFEPSQSRCSICCHSSKVEEVIKGFKEMSRDLTAVSSLEDSFLGKFDC